jgi:hypothetical protein
MYEMGDKEIAEDLTTFIRTSAIKEINRSTPFLADSIASDADELKLSIKIDQVAATGPYKAEGFFVYLLFIYVLQEKQEAGPSIASSRLSCTLTRGDQKLFTKTFECRKSIDHVVSNTSNFKEFRSVVSFDFAEGLSSTLKENIDAVVRETAYHLKNE